MYFHRAPVVICALCLDGGLAGIRIVAQQSAANPPSKHKARRHRSKSIINPLQCLVCRHAYQAFGSILVPIHILVSSHACIRACTHVCTHVRMHSCTDASTHVRAHACTQAFPHVWVGDGGGRQRYGAVKMSQRAAKASTRPFTWLDGPLNPCVYPCA